MNPLALAALFALRIASPGPEVQYKQPQLAALDNTVVLTFGAGKAIYFAGSTDGGRHFSPPIKVAEPAWTPLGRHRGPRIAIAPRSIVITAVTGVQGGGKDGDITAWRSADGGKTWSPGVRVTDAPAAAREGLHGMAAGANGTVFVTWLDLRSKGTKLYGSISSDGGATWSKNQSVYESPDGSICECCHPSALVGAQGQLYAMWRNSLAGARDIYLAVSHDKGRSFASSKLGEGKWMLKACPMDGGGLAADAKGQIYTVWRRDGSIYAARPGQAESLLGKGKDPAVAVGSAGPVYAWTENLKVVAVTPTHREPIALAPEGGFVSLAAANGNVVAAWEEKGAIQIVRLP